MNFLKSKKGPNPDDPLQKPLDKSIQLRYLLFLGLAVIPHLLNLHQLFSGFFYLLLIYRVIGTFYPRILPGTGLVIALSIITFIIFFFSARNLSASESSISFFLILSGLKMLELKRRRDLHFSILLGFFVVITVFLHSNSIGITALMIFSVVGMLSILIDCSRIIVTNDNLYAIRHALTLSIQALPVAIVLFFLFPRFSGPLWSFNLDDSAGKTGLSDRVSPGSISRLIQSNEVAFRVVFDKKIPTQEQRYWRGPVMWQTDGKTWYRSLELIQENDMRIDGSDLFFYTVFLQPSGNPWLVLLDLPFKSPVDSMITKDFQVWTERPVGQAIRYEGTSFATVTHSHLSEQQRKLGLQLPDNVSDRMRQLAASWKNKHSDPSAIVQAALSHFNRNNFIYTLRPPMLGSNPTDEFLFETKKGFCEHYATSFVLMMRLAGIPSRLVTGYLGGEINPKSDYLLVRQSDAHAWSEVWLPASGWMRVDPTAAIAPERIEHSLDINSLSQEGSEAIFIANYPGLLGDLKRNLNWNLDALNHQWQRWIIGYDKKRQLGFLSDIGLDWVSFRNLPVLAITVTMTIFFLIVLLMNFLQREKPKPIEAAYKTFCNRLKSIGIERMPFEGPMDYHQRILSIRPDLKSQVDTIIDDYINIVYSNTYNGDIKQWMLRINEFKPKQSDAWKFHNMSNSSSTMRAIREHSSA